MPVRWEIEAQLQELKGYIKSLRKEDRMHFEILYSDVKKHISSMSYANPLNPVELMQWSAILEIRKDIRKIKNEINRLICEQE